MNSADFLDLLRAKKGLTSDRKVAEYLGLNYGHVSNFRTGRRELPDATAVRFAEELGLPPSYVMTELRAHRAKDSRVKVIWENLAATIKKTHAFVIIALIGFGAFAGMQPVEAAGLSKSADNIHYTHKWRLLLAWLSRHLGLSPDALGEGLYSISILMMIVVAMGTLTGCAASPDEKAWQALHLVDVAQTINGPARDDCFHETDPITRRLIGRQPSTEAVIVWGIGAGVAHYALDRWLSNSGHADKTWVRIVRALDLGAKGFTIGRNHQRGIRPFGDNHCSGRR